MNGPGVSMSQVWVVSHTRQEPNVLLRLLPRRVGWYVLARHGCLIRDYGPYATMPEAESVAELVRADYARRAVERQFLGSSKKRLV